MEKQYVHLGQNIFCFLVQKYLLDIFPIVLSYFTSISFPSFYLSKRHSRQNQCQFVTGTAYRVDRHTGKKPFVEKDLPSSAGNSETNKTQMK